MQTDRTNVKKKEETKQYAKNTFRFNWNTVEYSISRNIYALHTHKRVKETAHTRSKTKKEKKKRYKLLKCRWKLLENNSNVRYFDFVLHVSFIQNECSHRNV